MPAQSLLQNVIQIEMISFPLGNRTADFQRDWPLFPYVLNASPYHLLWIDIEHFRLKVRIVRLRPQIAETIQPPAGSSTGSVGQRLRLIEIHQKCRVGKRVEPDVDQFLLVGERGHVGAPALAPVAD